MGVTSSVALGVGEGVGDTTGFGVEVAGKGVGVAVEVVAVGVAGSGVGVTGAACSVHFSVGCVPSIKDCVSVLGQFSVATMPESEHRDTFTFVGSVEVCGAMVAKAVLFVVCVNSVGAKLVWIRFITVFHSIRAVLFSPALI